MIVSVVPIPDDDVLADVKVLPITNTSKHNVTARTHKKRGIHTGTRSSSGSSSHAALRYVTTGIVGAGGLFLTTSGTPFRTRTVSANTVLRHDRTGISAQYSLLYLFPRKV